MPNITTIKKILLPTDFSEGSVEAGCFAISLAEKLQASVDVLHVIDFPNEPGLKGVSWITAQMLRDAEALAFEQLNGFTKEISKNVAVSHHLRMKTTGVASLICEHAEDYEVDCIVIAKHSRKGIHRLIVGSVADKVIRMASCPVMVVPTFLE